MVQDYRESARQGREATRKAELETRMERYVQLKLYESKGVMPNLAGRSALFRPTMPGRRPFCQDFVDVPVVNLTGISLEYRFFQLNQVDLTGWLALISLAKRRDDLVAAFTGREFLRLMRRQDNSRSYDWLRGPTRKAIESAARRKELRLLEQQAKANGGDFNPDHNITVALAKEVGFISRISGTQVRVGVTGQDQRGETRQIRSAEALAPRVMDEPGKDLYALELSKSLWTFFGVDSWSFIDLDARHSLGSNQWAQAFQAFLAANQSPFSAFKTHLWALWGQGYSSEQDFLKKFRTRVLKPLMALKIMKKVSEKNDYFHLEW